MQVGWVKIGDFRKITGSIRKTVKDIIAIIAFTSAYGASPLLVSRASRSVVASFSQFEADRKVLERAHRPGSTGPVASNSPPSLLLLLL